MYAYGVNGAGHPVDYASQKELPATIDEWLWEEHFEETDPLYKAFIANSGMRGITTVTTFIKDYMGIARAYGIQNEQLFLAKICAVFDHYFPGRRKLYVGLDGHFPANYSSQRPIDYQPSVNTGCCVTH